jgi:riboflavin kinase/FMN adenylyltransferase
VRVLEGDVTGWQPPDRGSAVSVGVFDGVHVGHVAVIDSLLEVASRRGLEATVLTFDRHPLAIIDPDHAPRLLTTLDQKKQLLAATGVETMAVLTFDDEVRSLTGDELVERVLQAGLGTRIVAAGPDLRFGRDRSGNVETLTHHGIEIEQVAIVGGDAPISSTAIRSLLAEGDVVAVATQLGRPFEIVGQVVRGAGRGAAIGFPTANLELDPSTAIPGHGVYAVTTGVGSEELAAVANVGVRPTFDNSTEVVEVHLLDAERDLYGFELRVGFISRLRAERRFDGPEALAAQIVDDVSAARTVHHTS